MKNKLKKLSTAVLFLLLLAFNFYIWPTGRFEGNLIDSFIAALCVSVALLAFFFIVWLFVWLTKD